MGVIALLSCRPLGNIFLRLAKNVTIAKELVEWKFIPKQLLCRMRKTTTEGCWIGREGVLMVCPLQENKFRRKKKLLRKLIVRLVLGWGTLLNIPFVATTGATIAIEKG